MPRAWAILSKCIKTKDVWLDNEYYDGVSSLDGTDSWHSFISGKWGKWLTWKERSDLYNDAFWWTLPGLWRFTKPWIWTDILDLDENAYYIARDNHWNILRDKDWNAIYQYRNWKKVNWNEISKKREKVFWFFSRRSKKMISAPSWWPWIKDMILHYVDYIKKEFPTLMTEKWFEVLQKDAQRFVEDVENGKGKQWWYNVIYNLFTTPRGNHWYFMSEILKWNTFDAMLSDMDVANALLGYDFSEVPFREFSEAAAVYAGTARWGNITIVDVLGKNYRDSVYWAKALKLFEIDANWNVTRVPKDRLKESVINKNYLMKLSLSQQIEQVKAVLGKNTKAFGKWSSLVKSKVWRYRWWWTILRWINWIWQPWFYSALMTVGKWLEWFMPLLVLNSWMFVTDSLARWMKLEWDRKWFFRKWWLNDWLPENIWWYSEWLWQTMWDVVRKWAGIVNDAVQQWLFNVWDIIMEHSYKVRQYQRFFESYFPGLKSVWDINRELEAMLEAEKNGTIPEWSVDKMLEAARWYAEYSVRLHTTNSPISAALTRVHPSSKPINQPIKDIFYTLWHFFAWWWYNKVAWAWKIIRTWADNVYHWKIWAKYLDDLLSWDMNIAEINAKMTRSYLENEDMLYFLHKVYTSFCISKYMDRLTEWEWEKNDQNFTDDFIDLFRFLDVFSWEYAALRSTPEWRVVKNFWDNFVWELELDAGYWTATQAWLAAVTKETFRSLFRKLYIPQIWTEMVSLVSKDWDSEEINWIKLLKKSVSDNVNGYLFYLKDKTENWDFSFYTPKWPNAYVNSILWLWEKEIDYINRQKTLSKYANLFNSDQWLLELTKEQEEKWMWINESHPFYNWVVYSFPFLKQWNISQIDEVEWFIDDLDWFRRTKAYIEMTNNQIPSDMQDQDWEYLYKVITWRLINNKELIDDDTLHWEYKFEDKYWEDAYNKTRQVQENLIHYLMRNWLSEEEAEKFSDKMNWKTDWFDEEAIRTLAYMEAKTPWSSLQAVAYLMNREWLNYVYRSWIYYTKWDPESEKILEQRQAQWQIEAAKKFAKYIPEIDRYNTWTQFILHYAKTHDTTLAKYISSPWDSNAKSMKLITPWSETVNEDWELVSYQNKILTQNFQAQLMVDIYWAMWDVDARKLMNWYSLIFDTSKYDNKDWTLNSKYAAYTLNQLESVYDHIGNLAIDSETEHKLKQGTLMYWDKLFPYIVADKELMKRDDVKQIVNDWTSYWYWEFRELDQIAIEAAEDQLSNKEYKAYWSKKAYLKWWSAKKFSWFTNWYDYMKNRAYSPTYRNYRVFDWSPRSWNQNYLSEREFESAKRAQQQFMYHWENPNSSKSWWGKWEDETIWVSSKRGKALQFYKREDPDKPTEYKLPWRKRWVRRWSGVKPISTTTWKHLTPTPKR